MLLIEQPCVLVSYVWMGMWSESQKWLRVCTVCLVRCTSTILSGQGFYFLFFSFLSHLHDEVDTNSDCHYGNAMLRTERMFSNGQADLCGKPPRSVASIDIMTSRPIAFNLNCFCRVISHDPYTCRSTEPSCFPLGSRYPRSQFEMAPIPGTTRPRVCGWGSRVRGDLRLHEWRPQRTCPGGQIMIAECSQFQYLGSHPLPPAPIC